MVEALPFHPAVVDWFEAHHAGPTAAQRLAWPNIKRGNDVLLAAPTGSGKTLAAFLAAIDDLVQEAARGPLPDETRILYISPLKALSSDIDKNLEAPLSGIRENLARLGITTEIRSGVRTGDTPQRERVKAQKRPPHIFVTTPESLYILLTSEGGRRMLGTCRTVIVDEIHALVRDKRGSHLALSLERLDALTKEQNPACPPVQRIGLSATQKPLSEVARFLVGSTPKRQEAVVVIDEGHQRKLDVGLWVPDAPLETIMSAEAWGELYDELAHQIRQHRTTLIFTNTRKLSERITRFLSERLGKEAVTSHHGSLSTKLRHDAERRLKAGKLKALVATASLELGIDIGDVELVCQLGSPGSIATFLQRVGRSGHSVVGTPKGRLFPTNRDDLVECAALLDAVRRGELDRVRIYPAPLDILCQQMIATLVPGEMSEDRLFDMMRGAYPYRELSRQTFNQVLAMVADGFTTSRGRRAAYVHYDKVGGRLKARRGARLAAITSGGAIPSSFDYDVVLLPTELKVGTVHEDFAIEASAGDVFQLGNASYQVEKVDPGYVRVRDATGMLPNLPFWLGEAPSRTDELSHSVSRLRQWLEQKLFVEECTTDAACRELGDSLGIPTHAAAQLVEHMAGTRLALGVMPTQSCIVAERFFDEMDGMHVVVHAPFGSRITRALGLALRKRFCRSFNVELQAAATEDALILSLGPMHSFPLEEIFSFLNPQRAEGVLVQALLDAPLFTTRWRWNATRALSVLRFRGGRRVAPRFQRMESDDLLALCFPDQVACLENIAGDREIPDHPLVTQTIYDSLHEAMDVDGLLVLLEGIREGTISCHARDLKGPSPFAEGVLGARPYAFLDDAPLEERRTQAVQMRRFLSPEAASDLGRLDHDAIIQVVGEVTPDPRDPDELHDTLSVHGALLPDEIATYERAEGCELLQPLLNAKRAVLVDTQGGMRVFAREWEERARAAYNASEPDALKELCRGRVEMSGPITNSTLAQCLGLSASQAETGLLALEAEGFVIRGQFRVPASDQVEFCERRLLARIHRLTLGRLRKEIEPVDPATFIDFLFEHQGVMSSSIRSGPEGVYAVLRQLSGLALPAGAWEASILKSRIRNYDPGYLDALCLSGRLIWGAPLRSGSRLTRATPLFVGPRDQGLPSVPSAESKAPTPTEPRELGANARRVETYLKEQGATFFPDLVQGTRLLEAQAELAVSELVAQGLATSDGFTGLRTLITPGAKRARMVRRPRGGRTAPLGLAGAGRISWLRRDAEETDLSDQSEHEARAHLLETYAWQLLHRWGVVFRKLLERETLRFPWYDVLRALRRLESRGEVRGGRFVTQFSGEQFAMPDAVSALRKRRREGPSEEVVEIAAADPLNLSGILSPESRTPTSTNCTLLFVGGQQVASRQDGKLTITSSAVGMDDLQRQLNHRRDDPPFEPPG